MRITIAASLAVSLLALLLAAPAARAAPVEVHVRIEGRARTLFEGPVSTAVHRVRASSDSSWRRCNGINPNVPGNLTPAPVPTSAAADAMRIAGESFDGLWYGGYEDYFLKRWGPDTQDEGAGQYWGVVVNNVFTSVGGCQYQLDGGDEVLWIYDAFANRPRLALYPAGYAGGALPLTATAVPGEPFEVEVDAWSGYDEGSPPPAPQRSSSPFQGAVVAPVETGEKGFQRIETESPQAEVTGAGGEASFTFSEPGWHRIKATALDAHGVETVIRSNRLDVCVPQPPAAGCGTPPPEDLLRTPPPPLAGEEEAEEGEGGPGGQDPTGGGAQAGPGPSGNSQAAATASRSEDGPVRLRLARLDRSRISRGLVKVGWRVLDAGVGIREWTISSLALGRRGVRYVTRASGEGRTGATLRLPPGAAYRLRLTVVDVLGRTSTASLGRVQVPA